MENGTLPDNGSELDLGWQALGQGDWAEALRLFSVAAERDPSAETYEGLGWAASWLNDVELSFKAWESSHRLFLERSDRRGAARTAMYLSTNHFTRRGDHAVANGWLRRAFRLLEDMDPCPEHAMVAAWDAYVAILVDHDADRARSCCEQAIELARAMGVVDVEVLARAIDGYALVVQGDIKAGMQLLDEATASAVSGEMSDLDAITVTCCFLIYACERVGDYARASQWCQAVMEIAERWSYVAMFAFCETHLAGILMWRGDWAEAEAHLVRACAELRASHPAMAFEGVVRLAELRRLQGRRAEAKAILEDAEREPVRMIAHGEILLERAWLDLDEGDAAHAIAAAERFLRSIPGRHRLEHAAAYQLIARAHAARGDLTAAEQAAEELEAIVGGLPSPAIGFGLASTRGSIALARGDLDAARRAFEDAIDLAIESGSPFAAAQGRIGLAETLANLGRVDLARHELRAAHAVLDELGAVLERERAGQLLARLGEEAAAAKDARGLPLTSRERDVLRLVAMGLSDREMARELGLSEHTIHRHVSNILVKLDAPSRAAAVAIAAKLEAL